MTTQQERIAQFRKMAADDPENELGHFSLGKALLETGELAAAAESFERTLALNPQISKAYSLLGQCYVRLNRRDQAVRVLRQGYQVADSRGDNMPRDEMAAMLRELKETPPASRQASRPVESAGGFACQRPGCQAGARAQPLPKPPINDALGREIHARICAACWGEWLGQGVKVINELRLDLSDERAQKVYEQYMREFLGF